ncbi:probable serine/threonine-protein kinase fhkB [Orbicella faveolata]|uniref:probable serine/threonine-protein kinase fhkB n=1 Tax=Orbicella faveolata TaxID=48498 RepID=UPI0009E21C8B|nr:probable serine/threonine-protein kinase fhkB [Orbicella faveolata]
MIRVAVAFILLIYLAMAFKLEKERLAFEDQPDAQDELDEQEQQYEARERARERDDPDEQDKGEQDEANEPYEGQDDLHDEEQDEYVLNETTDRDEQKERDEQDKNEEDNKVIERFTKKHTCLSNWLKSRSLSNYTKYISNELRFPAVSAIENFHILNTCCTFCCTWRPRFHVFPRLVLVTCFPALGACC